MYEFNPVILSERNIKETHTALSTGKLSYHDERIERELTDAIQMITDAFHNRLNGWKEREFWRGMVETLLVQFSKEEPEVTVMFIRGITNNDVNITYREFPLFRPFVLVYGPLLRRARCYKGV
ncbi:hypothetical protein XbC2_544 [Xanthomonas phage XbC2]|nr:hypothetical protein XbC2_544 [Xanthomonas phage XbC2]